ncbi:MAG: LysM peptidoglycan-binding domain-containing protein [Chloroflexi bacterium]|nr:LysM peptidoglycan-binding domain-containing protein [Chloroflexota bacterium]
MTCRPLWLAGLLLLAACSSPSTVLPTSTPGVTAQPQTAVTPLPTRGPHPPGELVPYQAQSGDTLSAVAAHFSTSVKAILEANPELAPETTTLAPGLALQVPAYYLPLTGTPFQILPDSELVYGPSAEDFDIRQALLGHPGFVSDAADYAYRINRPAWEVIEIVALNYSLNPRLLMALLEYGSSGLTDPFPKERAETYPIGHIEDRYRGLFRQLLWAAERLNDGYYGWRTGSLREFETADGKLYRPDSWQNAGTVAVQMLLAGLHDSEEFERAVGPEGFLTTYEGLWGDPYERAADHIPAQLVQPTLDLPFVPDRIWDFTGGPHFSWGTSLPMGALDFAPPAKLTGCLPSPEWVTAPAPGLIIRSEEAIVELDLDGDGYGGTGWVLFFFHMGEEKRIVEGKRVQPGDLLGHPSCEGGRSTGTHFHLARRYNGEWVPAIGPVPFVLDAWVAAGGGEPYEGTLTKGSKVVPACTCSTRENRILYELPEG